MTYSFAAIAYLGAALFYAAAVVPEWPGRKGLGEWLTFEKFCLVEFMTCHATTALAVVSLVLQSTPQATHLSRVGLVVCCVLVYVAFGALAFRFHRNIPALVAFLWLLVARSFGFFSLIDSDAGVARAECMKNFMMLFPLAAVICIVAFWAKPASGQSLQAENDSQHERTTAKIAGGVAAYYAVWTFVELLWPARIDG